ILSRWLWRLWFLKSPRLPDVPHTELRYEIQDLLLVALLVQKLHSAQKLETV
ncbi:hypothetical protein JOB18_046810, partial [Solea senegalensis]